MVSAALDLQKPLALKFDHDILAQNACQDDRILQSWNLTYAEGCDIRMSLRK